MPFFLKTVCRLHGCVALCFILTTIFAWLRPTLPHETTMETRPRRYLCFQEECGLCQHCRFVPVNRTQSVLHAIDFELWNISWITFRAFGTAMAQVYIRCSRGGQGSNPGRSLWDFGVKKLTEQEFFKDETSHFCYQLRIYLFSK